MRAVKIILLLAVVIFGLLVLFGLNACAGKHEQAVSPPDGGGNVMDSIALVFVKAGSFVMGSSEEDPDHARDEPQHAVTLTKDYYIGKYPVTFAEFDVYCDSNGIKRPNDHEWGRGNNPVFEQDWNDASAYCAWLSKQTGHTYRLPTEAEWEYAARGGHLSKGFKYSGSDDVEAVAWYRYNAGNKTQAVGLKLPNELGIYDMNGNVLEWCSDWYDDYYGLSDFTGTSIDPKGPDSSIRGRVFRGGSWYDYAPDVRVAYRSYASLEAGAGNTIGFRVVREIE